MIVAPERDTPGTSASIWHTPTPNARGSGVSLGVDDDGRRPQPFDEQHDEAADDERAGKHARALVQDRLDVVREERAGDEHRNRGDDDRRGEMPRLRAASQSLAATLKSFAR